jgi:hypothetical protein
MSKEESPPTKRKREHIDHINELRDKQPKQARKPDSQKLPIEFFGDNHIQIARTKNLLRINRMVQKRMIFYDIPLASFLMGFWPYMNQVKFRHSQKMIDILDRLISSMKAGITKIDMEMINDRLWAMITINGIHEFMWDVTDNFLVLCQIPDGTFEFYSFLNLMYVDKTNPYFEIDTSKYTVPTIHIPPHLHFLDIYLPSAPKA